MSFSFIFPGQGSQAPGMGKFLFDEFAIARNTYEEASDALSINMKKLCFEGSEQDLALTENTQPALLTTSVATARVLKTTFGIKPTATAGHSIGEYSSFVEGSVFGFQDAVRAVRSRGQYMQSAVPVGEGGMTATLGLDEAQAEFLCKWTEKNSGFKPVNPANFNCDGQIVISGSLKALNWLKDNFKSEIFAQNGLPEPRRAKLIPLTVSAPFHCDLMKPAEEKMRAFLNGIQFQNSSLPIFQNFHAKAETEASVLKENLIKQVSGSVKWTQSLLAMKQAGHRRFIECGHNTVLKGLLKKIDAEFEVLSTQNLDDLKLIEAAQK
ncbi:[acyl-carrier-protein] S-malonyltransferase [Bdellovibrio sp. qaytius]|nr:[acyl-carrier-protein] S-malonyltransferase [Bdellovibrio sp. qaytius]